MYDIRRGVSWFCAVCYVIAVKGHRLYLASVILVLAF